MWTSPHSVESVNGFAATTLEKMLCPSTYKRGASTVLTSEEQAMLTERLIYAGKRGFAVGQYTSKSMMSQIASDGRPCWKDGVPSEDAIPAFRAIHREITFKNARKGQIKIQGRRLRSRWRVLTKCWKTSRRVILGIYPMAAECGTWMKPVFRVSLEKEPKDSALHKLIMVGSFHHPWIPSD